jgi:hypothetical protein
MNGIMFIEDLFNKTISGKKTQTRRLGELLGMNDREWKFLSWDENKSNHFAWMENKRNGKTICVRPRYRCDEILFLKEPYISLPDGNILYKYNGDKSNEWENKMFMPEKRARHFIRITDVRIEPLLSISDYDAIREGIELPKNTCTMYEGIFRDEYLMLWDKINKKEAPAYTNPYCFVYDYELTIKC